MHTRGRRHVEFRRLALGLVCALVMGLGLGLADPGRGRAQTAPASAPPAKKPILWVWTADWCAPCRAFWADYNTDADFRRRIDAVYSVREWDADKHPICAFFDCVTGIPAFRCPAWQKAFCGYTTKSDLLARLGLGGERAVAPGSATSDPNAYTLPVPPQFPGQRNPPAAPSGLSSPSTGRGTPQAAVDFASISRDIATVRGAVEGLQKGLDALGAKDPAAKLGAIDSRLAQLQSLEAKVDGLEKTIPAPIHDAVKGALAAELPKLAPGLAAALGTGAGGAVPAAGLAGLVAAIAAGIGFPPLGVALGIGAASWGLISFVWGALRSRLAANRGLALPPAQLAQLAQYAPHLLSALAARGPQTGSGAQGSPPASGPGAPPLVVPGSPPPQQVVDRTNYVPVQIDENADALAWAKAETGRLRPEYVPALQLLESLMAQYGRRKAAPAS